MKAKVLHNSLKVIDQIYKESLYGRNDLYRIQDICDSMDEAQWESKEVLIKACNFLNPKKIIVLGGWYGVLGALAKSQWPDAEVLSIDIDPVCETIGKSLLVNSGIDITFQQSAYELLTQDGIFDYDLILSSSTEHFEPDDVTELLAKKSDNTYVALQNNDYKSHNSHINTYPSLDLFVESLQLNEITHKSKTVFPIYTRYTVVGK